MNASIYVGNLAGPYISPDMLRSIFGCIGAISEVRIGKNGRYAFVEFRDPKCAVMALGLNGTMVAGEPLLVEQTKTKPGGADGNASGFFGGAGRPQPPFRGAPPYSSPQYSGPPSSRPSYTRGGPGSDRPSYRGHRDSESPSFHLRQGQLPTPAMVLGALNVLSVAMKSGMSPLQMAKASGKSVDPDLQDFVEKMTAGVEKAKRLREDKEGERRKRAKTSAEGEGDVPEAMQNGDQNHTDGLTDQKDASDADEDAGASEDPADGDAEAEDGMTVPSVNGEDAEGDGSGEVTSGVEAATLEKEADAEENPEPVGRRSRRRRSADAEDDE